MFLSIICCGQNKEELNDTIKVNSQEETDLKLLKKKRNNFTLKNREEYKLINSAIKQDYNIIFSGNIVEFDTLIIGKGTKKYLSSYITIDRDSIIFSKITSSKTVKSYKHNLSLKNNISIYIDRKVHSALVTIINEKDTLKITSNFVGMNNPFIRSLGSVIDVQNFEFTCNDYNSDVFIFGDSYVNCDNPKRWPFYLYNKGYNFFCDGLPGGTSIDSYDYLKSALSVNKPKYVIWTLGMNDHSNGLEINYGWNYYVKKIMGLCSKNNISLILATIPSTPTIDNTRKNKFVRESGYKYIDFDKAVSDSNGNWKNEMLSNDGVHPTELGAKALSERLLMDFPSIVNYSNFNNN